MTKPMWRFRRLEEGCPLKVMVPCRFMCLNKTMRHQCQCQSKRPTELAKFAALSLGQQSSLILPGD